MINYWRPTKRPHYNGCRCVSAWAHSVQNCAGEIRLHAEEPVRPSPVYFRDVRPPVVCVACRSRLRPADRDDMAVACTWTVRYGPRCFHVSASQIWNTLPSHLNDINVNRKQPTVLGSDFQKILRFVLKILLRCVLILSYDINLRSAKIILSFS